MHVHPGCGMLLAGLRAAVAAGCGPAAPSWPCCLGDATTPRRHSRRPGCLLDRRKTSGCALVCMLMLQRMAAMTPCQLPWPHLQRKLWLALRPSPGSGIWKLAVNEPMVSCSEGSLSHCMHQMTAVTHCLIAGGRLLNAGVAVRSCSSASVGLHMVNDQFHIQAGRVPQAEQFRGSPHPAGTHPAAHCTHSASVMVC